MKRIPALPATAQREMQKYFAFERKYSGLVLRPHQHNLANIGLANFSLKKLTKRIFTAVRTNEQNKVFQQKVRRKLRNLDLFSLHFISVQSLQISISFI